MRGRSCWMIFLWLFLPAIALSAEIDWKSCIAQTKCYMLAECKEGSPNDKALYHYPANNAEMTKDYTCDTGFQNLALTPEMVLLQMQVKAGDIADKELAIYHGAKLFAGCKKNEDGKVVLFGEPELIRRQRIELFEDRSVFEADRAICAIKLENMIPDKFAFTMRKVYGITWNNDKPEVRYLNKASQPVKMELFSGADSFLPKIDSEQCDPFSFQQGIPTDSYHVLPITDKDRKTLDCANHKRFTYTLRSTLDGTNKDVESLTCTGSHEYEMKGPGSGTAEKLKNVYNYQFSCITPISRLCDNPFPRCTTGDCPVFTPGTDADEAKLECAGNKWLINGDYHVLQDSEKPRCRDDEVPNSAAFFIGFAAGGQLRLSDAEKVSCFTEFDCVIKSNLDYSDCKASDNATCGVLLYADGIMKCADPLKYQLSAVQPGSTATHLSTQFTCDRAKGAWSDGNVTLADGAQVFCHIEIETKEYVSTFTQEHVKYVIMASVVGALLLATPIIIVCIVCTRRWNRRKANSVDKKKWKKMSKVKRVKHAKKIFQHATNATKDTAIRIVHGFNLLEILLDTNTEDPDVWEAVFPFLVRGQSAFSLFDVHLGALCARYLFLRAKKIIDKHGCTSATPITKDRPKGLMRTFAIKLFARCAYSKYAEESTKLLEDCYRKLGFDAVAQYPHCGELWSAMAQLYHTSYAHPSDALRANCHLKFGAFTQQLEEYARKPPSGLKPNDIIPQFGSISQQAISALSQTINPKSYEKVFNELFKKAEKPDAASTEMATHFYSGMAHTMRDDCGPMFIAATKKMAHDYEGKDKIQGFVAIHEILRSLTPAWAALTNDVMKTLVYTQHPLDAMKLQDLIMPEEKEPTEHFKKLRASQRLFEEAVVDQGKELRAWFTRRVDLAELKAPPPAHASYAGGTRDDAPPVMVDELDVPNVCAIPATVTEGPIVPSLYAPALPLEGLPDTEPRVVAKA